MDGRHRSTEDEHDPARAAIDRRLACPICGTLAGDLSSLATHLVERAEASDGPHVMWLNRNVTKHHTSAADLEPLLGAALTDGRVPGDRVKR